MGVIMPLIQKKVSLLNLLQAILNPAKNHKPDTILMDNIRLIILKTNFPMAFLRINGKLIFGKHQAI